MIHNSTILTKKKKCVSCGSFTYIFSKGRCKSCATIQSTQKRIAKQEEEEDTESLQNLIDDADYWFSRLIRLKYCDTKGMVRCYTSNVEMRWQDSQCGHFIPRVNLATRWMEDNCRPQSKHDNCFLDGNIEVFAAKLEKEKAGIVEWLKEQSRQVVKPTYEEIKQMIADFRHRSKMLEKKIKNIA